MAAPTKLQNVKKALANPEPSTHGTFETCPPILRMSVHRGRPEAPWFGQTDANDPFQTRASSDVGPVFGKGALILIGCCK